MDFSSIALFNVDSWILSVFFWVCITILLSSIIRTCAFAYSLKRDINEIKNKKDTTSRNRLLSIRDEYLSTLSANQKTTVYAADVFSLDTVSQAYRYNLKLRNVTPNILTSLGILGTFVGLAMSLADFDSQTSEGIRSSIQTLLGGMNTAFVTSVIGMGCSIVFLIIERYSHNNNVRRLNTLCSFLDKQYYCSPENMILDAFSYFDEEGNKINPADSLISIQESVNKMRKQMETLGADICDSFGNALDASFQDKLVPIINDLSQKLENPAQAVTDSLISELQRVCNDFSDNMTKGLTEKMDELMERFIDASNSIQTLPDTIDIVTKGLNVSTQDTMIAIQELTDGIELQLKQLNDLSVTFGTSISQLSDSANTISLLHTKLMDVPNVIRSASEAIENTTSEILEIQRAADETMISVKSVNDTTIATVHEFTRDANTIKNGLSGIFGEINDGLSQYSDAVQQSMNKVLDPFTTSVATATEKVANAIAPLNDAVADLGNFNDSVKVLLKDIDESFKPIEHTLKQLADIKRNTAVQIKKEDQK